MSERISTVVPNGTRERIKKEAEKQKRTASNLQMKYILDGLNGNQIVATIIPSDLNINLNRGGKNDI